MKIIYTKYEIMNDGTEPRVEGFDEYEGLPDDVISRITAHVGADPDNAVRIEDAFRVPPGEKDVVYVWGGPDGGLWHDRYLEDPGDAILVEDPNFLIDSIMDS